MFEAALAYLGLQVAKFRFRSDVDLVQPMTDFFRSAKHVLITLPTEYEEAVLASDALRELRAKRRDLRLTVVHTSTRTTSLADFPNCEVVRIDPADIGRLSLPTRAFLQRLLHHPFDVAVDLNLDFVLHTAYICKASRAKVRVGFVHEAADAFFNVQLRMNTQQTPQALYRHYAAFLAMF
jgi:ADP-heptose:LPS heptosyltransferase